MLKSFILALTLSALPAFAHATWEADSSSDAGIKARLLARALLSAKTAAGIQKLSAFQGGIVGLKYELLGTDAVKISVRKDDGMCWVTLEINVSLANCQGPKCLPATPVNNPGLLPPPLPGPAIEGPIEDPSTSPSNKLPKPSAPQTTNAIPAAFADPRQTLNFSTNFVPRQCE